MKSKSDNQYILTVCDYSKWVEAVPLPSKHAIGVANLQGRSMKQRFPMCNYIINAFTLQLIYVLIILKFKL